ncbi:MAG: type II toxin-antitoxin system VapC family toxin [Bacteroidota bacterium]
MAYLLDTQVLIWIFGEPEKLTTDMISIIKNPKNDLYVSLVSFWEMAVKINIGKLALPVNLEEFMQETMDNDIKVIEVRANHILGIVDMPLHHRDPFDRLILSQSIFEGIPIISSDNQFKAYDVKLIT